MIDIGRRGSRSQAPSSAAPKSFQRSRECETELRSNAGARALRAKRAPVSIDSEGCSAYSLPQTPRNQLRVAPFAVSNNCYNFAGIVPRVALRFSKGGCHAQRDILQP